MIQGGSTALLATLQLASVMILSRLISPVEFGYAATASGAAVIGLVLSDVGFGASLIRKRKLTDRFFNIVVTLALFVILSLNLAVFAAVALTWKNVRITELAALFGAGASFMAIAGVLKSVLLRDRRYFDLFKINGGAYTIGMIICAATLAALGHGALSIAWGQLIYGFCTLMFAALQVGIVWRPAFSRKLVRPIFSFGIYVVFNRILEVLLTEVDKIFMAYFAGFSRVGTFERVGRAGILVGGHSSFIVDSVLYPRFCREVQIQGERKVDSAPLLIASTLVSIAFVGLGFLSPLIIAVVLGPTYATYAPVLSILLIAAYLRIQSRPIEVFFRAIGKPHVTAWIKVLPVVLLVIGLIAMAKNGFEYWAWVFVAAQGAVILLQAIISPMFGVRTLTCLTVFGLHCPLTIVTMIAGSSWVDGNASLAICLLLSLGAMGGAVLIALTARGLSGVGWTDVGGLIRKVLNR